MAAAHRLNQVRPDLSVVLYEASERLGGVIKTERAEGYLVEHAADNFLRGPTAPWAEELCRQIGFTDELIATDEARRGAHVVWRGQLYPVPAGFQLLAPARLWPILTSRLLSWSGRLRLCLEPLIAEPTSTAEESLTQFATRRLGREGFERLVQPLVSGIYTADPDRLSVQAALPQMVQMVREHGSLYRAMRHRQRQSREAATTRGARYSLFVAPRGGMSDLIDAVAARLTHTQVEHQTPVAAVRREAAGDWSVEPVGQPARTFAGVIVALPGNRAADVLTEGEPELAAELRSIELASSVVVCWGVRRDQIQRPLDAFGCVVPSRAGRQILAISYSSLKFPGRAPEGRLLLRVFLGGALQPELTQLDDAALDRVVGTELRELLGYQGVPELRRVVRWPAAMPQYHVGHLDKIKRIESLLSHRPGLQLAGNALRGVGIPQCVHSGQTAADAVLAKLRPAPVAH